MNENPIYLDYNGTTPCEHEVLQTMLPYFEEQFGNPSTKSPYGQRAKAGLEKARAQVAALIGAPPEEVYFTAGATEANNWAIFNFPGGQLVSSQIDHPSVLQPCAEMERRQVATVARLPVDGQGLVSPDALSEALRTSTRLVSIMHSNNEIGTLQPIAELAERTRRAGAVFHTDAAQSLGKVPVNVVELGVDMLTVAGHKLYGPKGIGALYVRKGIELRPFLWGAGQEGGMRSGTENVALAVGLGHACELAAGRLPEDEARLRGLRDLLQERLQTALGERVVLNGHPQLRLPNTLSVNFVGLTGAELLSRCPELAASTGPACHDGVVRLSHVLAALGVDPEIGKGAVRLTLGRHTKREEVETAAQVLIASYSRLVEVSSPR